MSDYDHLRGKVRVCFSAPPSDVVDQNPHDGCHRLHYHSHDSGHLSDLSSQGMDKIVIAWIHSISFFALNLVKRHHSKRTPPPQAPPPRSILLTIYNPNSGETGYKEGPK